MARYGTLGDYRFGDPQEAAIDIRGAKVYGPGDEKLGEIADVVFDENSGGIIFVVIDTGGWLSTKRFVVPPQRLRPSLQHEDDFLVDLTKEQIETFPPYDSSQLTSEEEWADYENRYRSKWVEAPVMHREGTDRNVTPTTKQQLGAGTGSISTEEGNLEELDNETDITALHPQISADISPNTPAYRWTTFEDTLRRRREDVLQSSIDNLKRADAASDERFDRRKAS